MSPFRFLIPSQRRIGVLPIALLLHFLLLPAASAQQTVAGIINNYYEVVAMNSCTLTLNFTGGLNIGDRIIIIQMRGAAVDESESSTYGDVTNGYGNAGLWEVNGVTGVTSNKISLREQPINTYTVGPGRVQVVRLPSTTGDMTVTSTVTGFPWDGTVGGVVAMEADGTITLDADIDASGLGFPGGTSFHGTNASNCSSFAMSSSDAGARGTGVAAIAGNRAGRGAPANGGGGGANHNAGGGGGGNGGAGGLGGAQFQGTQCSNIVLNGGVGGHAIDYGSLPLRLFMGGGGGGGHENNGGISTGGKGGGIIIILGGDVKGNGHSIISNGQDAVAVPDDGAGGGGGGGAIYFGTYKALGPLTVSAQGGRGGDANSPNEVIGPGGGGGGGALASPAIATFTANLSGGATGLSALTGDSHGAQPGASGTGIVGHGRNYPEGTNRNIVGLVVRATGPTSFCKGGKVTLNTGIPYTSYEWIDPDGRKSYGAEVVADRTGDYQLTVTTADGCEGVDRMTITVWDPPEAHAGVDIPPCDATKFQFIGFDATGGTPPYRYSWSPAAGLSDATISHPSAKPDRTTTYTMTVTDAHGCTSTDDVVVNVVTPMNVDMPSEVSTCAGTPITIGNIATGGTPGYGYQWKPAVGLDNPTFARPLANPDRTTTYYLRLNDVNGCIYFDTITVVVKPLPIVSAGPDLILCSGSSVPLTVTRGSAYKWTPATGLSCADCRAPIASPKTTTRYIVAVTDSLGCIASDTVMVVVRTPKISSASGTIDFGSLLGCTTSAQHDFVLRNDDSADIDIDQATFSDAGFAVVAPGFPIHIKAHDSVTIHLRFTPVKGGTSTGRMTLKALCNTQYAIDLTGIKPTTAIASDPAVVDFGRSFACQTVTADSTIIISNTGTAPLIVGTEVVSAPFSVTGPALPRTVQPGDTIHLVVRYAPVGAGTFATDLALPFQAGACSDTLRITLNATRLQPRAAASLASISFPPLLGCDATRDTSIVVVNTGDSPITIDGGIGAAGFKLTNPTPTGPIAPGDSITLTLAFRPAAQGASSTRFALVYGPCHDTIPVNLSGTKEGISFQLPDSIDFGDLAACAGSTLHRKLTITNNSDGTIAGLIRESSITGEFGSSIVDGAPVPNGQSVDFDITFTPTRDGTVAGTLDITLDPCGIRRSIILTGRRVSPAVTAVAPLNLGQVPAGGTASGAIRFRNTGTGPITIDRIDGVTAPFNLAGTQPALPAILLPGDELIVTIQFDATIGAHQETITAVATIPCSISTDAVVEAEGTSLGGTTAIMIPSVTAAPGDTVVIPLTITSAGSAPAASIGSYRTTLRFDRKLLIPVTKPVSDAIVGGDRVVTYTGQSNGVTPPGVFASIRFIAALGDTLITPVAIDSFAWNDQRITVTTSDGLFTLRDICLTGGQRLINADGNLTLKAAYPNPAGAVADIEYEVVEYGRTELYVTDLLGRRVALLVDAELVPGGYIVRFDTRELNSGTYFYTLQTPTGRLTRMMQIRK
ncbi:MAG: 5-nucleotidase [Chlorobi bacterium]|nr:5-nucleotidase [Chlorobiota bacterium]